MYAQRAACGRPDHPTPPSCAFNKSPNLPPSAAGAKGEELVEGLFGLAAADRSRLLLLGIANSIDLVQQLLRPGGPLHVSGGWGEGRAAAAAPRGAAARELGCQGGRCC